MRVNFRIFGDPKGQPRHRGVAVPTRNPKVWTVRYYNPKTADAWKWQVAHYAKAAFGSHRDLDGAVTVDGLFIFKRPQRLLRKKDPAGRIPHLQKPDRDNLEKAVLDALVDARILRDDCIVWGGEIRKVWQAKDEPPGAILTVTITPAEVG